MSRCTQSPPCSARETTQLTHGQNIYTDLSPKRTHICLPSVGEDPWYDWPLAECGLTSAGAPLGAGADSRGPLHRAKCGKFVKRTGTWESSWEFSQQSEHKFIDDPASLHHRIQRDIWKGAHPRRWTRVCMNPKDSCRQLRDREAVRHAPCNG